MPHTWQYRSNRKEKVGNKRQDIRNDMVRVIRNAKRLQKVACDILELSIIENGGNVKLHVNKVEITSLISTVIEEVQSKYVVKTKNFQIIFQPYHDMIIVRCDALKMSQVLFNLFDNANKFTQYGNIVCSLHLSNSYT
jgi:two-component system, NarL family, sensor histidine kinase EvgS